MNRVIAKDATDQSVTLVILTESGTPKTDVVHNTASLVLWYRREGGAKVTITPAALATPKVDDPHLDGGFIHIGDGVYRLDLPDAAVASGADYVTIGGSVPDGVILSTEVQLVTVDLQAANLPANVTQWKGTAPADLTDTDKVQVSVQHMLDGVITSAKIANNAITADKIASNAITEAKIASSAITAAKLATDAITSDKIAANAIGADQLANTAVAKIEAALIDDDDGQALLNAIVQAIDAADIDSDLLPGLIRDAILNRVLAGNHDTPGSVGRVLQDILTDTGTTLDGKLDTIDGVVDAIKVVTDKLDTTVESDGDGKYQFTETALENAPAGGGLDAEGVREAIGLASPNLDEQLAPLGDLATLDDLATPEEVAAAVDSSLQISFADVIAWSAAGLTMVQESTEVPGAYQFTSDAVSEIDVGEVVVDLTEIEEIQSQILSAVQNGINVSVVDLVNTQSALRANETIRVAKNEARSWTITHDGLDLTGATLRFTVYRVQEGNEVGIFKLEGTSVVGGNGATTIKLSSSETARLLGENHYWDLWQNPDDPDMATRWGSGPFRVVNSKNNVQ